MKTGIMQPYFFPYVGYFSLIDFSDKFIFFDTPQYISHGWINRNRILKSDGTATYFTVPISKHHQTKPIYEISINNMISWKDRIWGQLTAYKRKAPYYKRTIEFLHGILDMEFTSLSELDIFSTMEICKLLGIKCEFDVYSKMKVDIEEVNAPDEWALNICKKIGATTYVNPPGGMSFFDAKKYKYNDIELLFLKSNLKPYIQRIGRFEPALSIIDMMMFCNEKEIMECVRDYSILREMVYEN